MFVKVFSTIALLSSLLALAQVEDQTQPSELQKAAPPKTMPLKTEPEKAAPHSAESRRPRIALALEGGGALGLAHVGVLEWFDEHHIPVDAVAGTSMGGLIGGFYASGMSGDEIKLFADTIDWNRALRDQVPYRDLAFRRKEDKREYPADLEFGLKGGVRFPLGLSSGQQVGLILDRVGAPYSSMTTFDDLPTPFRCVATDLVSGNPVVFDKGSLSDALRGTMSLPGVFNPLRQSGQVYVDGGLVDNLPVDVARSMGADMVIAVHLRSKPFTPTQGLSALDVLQGSVSVVIASNELQSMEQADILISVATQDYGALDYQASDKLEELGVKAAQDKASVLQRFALNDEDWKAYLAQREARRRSAPTPEFVKVVGPSPEVAQGLENKLQDNVGKPLDYARINRDMDEITGLGRFDLAGYELTQQNGLSGLLVKTEEKDYAPPIVNPLIVVDGSEYTNVLFGLGARITLLDIGGYGSEWRNDFLIGSEYSAASEYYHPVKWSNPFFVAPRLFASDAPFDLYDNNSRVASYREDQAGGGLDFGVTFNRYSQLRFGYQVEHLSLTRQIGTPDFGNLSGRQGFSRVLYSFDNTDDPTLPRQGFSATTRLEFYDANPGAAEHFPLFESETGLFKQLRSLNSVFVLASGGSTFGRDDIGLPPFSLGGPLRLGAYGTNEILTNQYFLIQPGYIRQLRQLPPLFGNHIYAVATYEVAKTYDNLFHESKLPTDVNIGLLVQTFFGPVVFGGSVGDSGHRKFYFQLGRYF
jgi:NTE family protein